MIRPDIERFKQDALDPPNYFSIVPMIISGKELETLPYHGKDKDLLILELCLYIEHLEKNINTHTCDK